MRLKGEVKYIVFQNEDNGYMVADFKVKNEVVTIVGTLLGVYQGDTLILEGEQISHREYGDQFKVVTFEKEMPKTTSALKKYLSNGNIKGIGEKLAEKIVDKFQEDTVEVLKYNPEKIEELKRSIKGKGRKNSAEFYRKLGDMANSISTW